MRAGIAAFLCFMALLVGRSGSALAFAAGDSCSTANRVYRPEGGGPALICDGTKLVAYRDVLSSPIREGINTTSPQTTLDVNGEIRVGTTGATCSSTDAGALQFTSTSSTFDYCNGTSWTSIGGGGSASAAGSSREIQFNSGGSFGASSTFKLESDGDLLLTGTYTGTASVPVTGAGTRMFFDTQDAAFRAGYVDGTQWDNSNVGQYSVSMGYDTTASGYFGSTAFGNATIASGNEGFAVGLGSAAVGDNGSVAMGFHTTASGTASTALGYAAKAGDGTYGNSKGNYSMAFGLTGSITTNYPEVTGQKSLGIFMGAQTNVNVTDSQVMAILGGKVRIDPAAPATYATPATALDVNGTIKIADGGETCSSTTAGAIRYASANVYFCNGTSWLTLENSSSTESAAGSANDIQYNSGGALGGSSKLTWDASKNEMGVNTASPAATLDVNGEVKLGNSGLTCSSTTNGALRYNSASSCVQLCDGTSWNCISTNACSDTTPNAFNFTDLVNQNPSTLVGSNILQITGMTCNVSVTVSGQGSPEYRVCADSSCATVIQGWTSSAGSAAPNDYVQLELTTSATGGDTYSATLTVGNMADVWNASTTGNCSGSPAVGTICADGTVYAGTTPDGMGPMYVTRCDAGQSWNGTTCSGTRLATSWNNGTSNWTTTGYISGVTGQSNTAGLNGLSDAGSPYYAAQYCATLNEDGYTDWYLPALNELNVIYSNEAAIGNFGTGGASYWTSTEYGNTSAWLQRFSDGSQSNTAKYGAYYVRCTRK